MFMHKLWLFGAVILAATLTFGPIQAAEQVSFTGDVTYRKRIALPPDAELVVTLVRLDAPHAALAGARAIVSGPGQVPLHFVLNVRSDVLSASQSYGLVAEIRSGGTAMFASTLPVAVDPAAPEPVLLMVNFAAPPPVTPPVAPDPTAALFDTQWSVTAINGQPVLASTAVSMSIAPDRRVGGNGGCNSYFTEAMLDGTTLQFGPVAGTRMACDASVMVQEAAFFAALSATAAYELDGQELALLGSDGQKLLRLARQ